MLVKQSSQVWVAPCVGAPASGAGEGVADVDVGAEPADFMSVVVDAGAADGVPRSADEQVPIVVSALVDGAAARVAAAAELRVSIAPD
jgi:hypothetical protein